MGFLDKTKDLGKATAGFGGMVGHKGVDLGKKGVEATKQAIRTKLCVECKSYSKVDENSGDCPIGGKRLSSASADTCPQKAFAPK